MLGKIIAAFAGLCLLAMTFSSAEAEPRVALVIGNSSYGNDIGKLPNPANDAALIASALQKTGFTVIKVIDADQKQMKRKIAEFGDQLAAAGPQATGLFYYAGHGVQSQGQNYLIPVGADISKEADVDIESVSADDVMKQMDFAANAVNIIVLDACRNNPIARSMRSATRGLAPMKSDSVRGTFIAYSTAPGKTAADGSGKNSPYSQALASALVQPGVGIEEIFRDVRGKVMQATNNQQIPWDSSSLTAPFFFKPAGAQFTTATAAPAAPAPKPAAASTPASREAETSFWKGIQESKQASDYEAYLEQYPNGLFVGLAKNRLASLGAGAPREQPAAPAVQEPAATPVATQVTPEPEPVAEPVSTQPVANDGILRDSRGLDCRIKDATRSQSECQGMNRANGGGGGYSGGGKSTGSQRWQ
jgi:carboxyl-terminal processing protease